MEQQQFILTTEQLAQAYGVTSNALVQNYRRHKEDFQENIHYFLLEGEDLKNFENDSQSFSNFENDSQSSSNFEDFNLKPSKRGGTRRKYLWTQKGAFAHAWILKSPGAKVAYEKLIELAEKPQTTTGISPEAFALLQEKYEITLQAYLAFIQGIAEKRMPYNAEDMVDGTIIIHRLTRHFLDLIQGEKRPQPIYQQILTLLERIDKNWTQTQNYLEEHYYEVTGAQIEISNLESDVRTTANNLKALTAPMFPLLESPR